MTWGLSVLLVRATAVLLAGLVLSLLLRRSSAAARHAVWVFVLGSLLVLPALERYLPRFEVPVLPPTRAVGPLADVMPAYPAEMTSDVAPPAEVPGPLAPTDAAPTATPWRMPDANTVLTAAWMAGVAAGLAQLLVGAWLVRRVARRAVRIDEHGWVQLLEQTKRSLGVRSAVRLVASDSVAVPVVWGYRDSCIMLPKDASSWSEERRRLFLLHELSHVRRRDCLTLLVARLARLLYWPNPLAWWAVREVRREAERACDDRVVNAGARGSDYAHHLLDAVKALQDAPRPLAVLAVAERSNLEDRLVALLDPGLRRGAMTRRGLAFGAGLSLVIATLVAALQPVARAVAAEVKEAATTAPVPRPTPATVAVPVPAARPSPRPTTAIAAIEGTVVGPDRKPIGGARVLLWPDGKGDWTEETRTDAAGAFRLMPRGTAPKYRLRVDADGLAAHVGEAGGAPLRIALAKGVAIEGTVYDARTRKPVEGAEVTTHPDYPTQYAPSGDHDSGRVKATTDASGRYRLLGLGADRFTVTASGPGLSQADRATAAPATGIDFFLEPGATVSGRVLNEDGGPAERAVVTAEALVFPFRVLRSAPTDVAGRFRLPGLPPDRYRLVASAPGAGPGLLEEMALEEGESKVVDLRLTRAVEIIGRLVDAEGGLLPGHVRVRRVAGHDLTWSSALSPVAEVGEDGRFTLHQKLGAGEYTLSAQARGFADKDVDLRIAEGETTHDVGDVVFDLGRTIRGRVVNHRGQPIPNAQISTHIKGAGTSTQTQPDGSFRLAGLPEGRCSVRATARGFAGENKEVEAGASQISFTLAQGSEIMGTAVDAQDRPISAVHASVIPREGRPGMNARPSADEPPDANGRFRVRDLWAGAFTLRLDASGFSTYYSKPLEVAVGQSLDLGRVILDRGGTVQGVVVDDQGQAVPGAEVWLVEQPLNGVTLQYDRKPAFSDASGRFRLDGVPVGPASLRASHKAYPDPEPIEVSVDPATRSATARIVLPAGGRIAGRVRWRRPPEADVQYFASLGARGAGPWPEQVPISADGTFTIDSVRAGRVNLLLVAGRGGRYDSVHAQHVMVRAGETTSVDLTVAEVLVQGRAVRGGQPLPGAQVRLSVEGSFHMVMGLTGPPSPLRTLERLQATTRDDGTYEMLVPVPGKYRIWLSGDGVSVNLPAAARTVDVPDAETFQLDFDLPASGITGRVLASDTQRPLERSEVAAVATDGDVFRARPDAAGRFDLSLSPGSYRLTVKAPGYVNDESPLEVAPSDTLERSFELVRGSVLKVRVVDSDGRPVFAPRVAAFSPDGRTARGAQGGPDGVTSIDGLAAGEYNLFAISEAKGFGLAHGIAPGPDTTSISLSLPSKLRLRVLGADGRPHANQGVGVRLVKWGGTLVGVRGIEAHLKLQTTDGDGMVEVPLPVGEVDLDVETGDLAQRAELHLTTRPGPQEASVTLQRR